MKMSVICLELSNTYWFLCVQNTYKWSSVWQELSERQISRKNQDEADYGVTCFYILFSVRKSSPKITWSGRFLIPHQGYERNELCCVRDPGR